VDWFRGREGERERARARAAVDAHAHDLVYTMYQQYAMQHIIPFGGSMCVWGGQCVRGEGVMCGGGNVWMGQAKCVGGEGAEKLSNKKQKDVKHMHLLRLNLVMAHF